MIQILTTLLVYAIPSVLAITLHESAHAYAARCFGDSTAYRLGRLSLNPLHHIDPVGTILVPGLLLLSSLLTGMGGILFGWAKPVPVNFAMLRNPKRDMIWVALAGPACNCLGAFAAPGAYPDARSERFESRGLFCLRRHFRQSHAHGI